MINAFKYFKGYVKNGIDLLYMAIEDKSRKNVWKLQIKILCNIGGKLLTTRAINSGKDYPVRQ